MSSALRTKVLTLRPSLTELDLELGPPLQGEYWGVHPLPVQGEYW